MYCTTLHVLAFVQLHHCGVALLLRVTEWQGLVVQTMPQAGTHDHASTELHAHAQHGTT